MDHTPFYFSFFFLGSKNWGIRLLNYWVVFAAPVVAVSWFKAARSAKIAVVLLLSFFMTVSLIHSSKDADLFRFESIWEKDDIAAIEWLCQHEGKYCIKHTGHDFRNYYSKETSYKRLMTILCGREAYNLQRGRVQSGQKNREGRNIPVLRAC